MKLPKLKIFTGPMFGGKTTKMLAALERYQYQNKNTMLFKPSVDKRYSEEKVVTHKGQSHTSMLVNTGADILERAQEAEVVAIDELFMIPGSAEAIITLFKQGKTILVSTLQLSSRSAGYEAFEEVQKIMPWATAIEVCPAVCSECDNDAYYTKRLISDTEQVLVGGAESYQPVCYHHSAIIGERE